MPQDVGKIVMLFLSCFWLFHSYICWFSIKNSIWLVCFACCCCCFVLFYLFIYLFF